MLLQMAEFRLFMAVLYSIMYKDHIFFILSSISVHLG
jgi:hypothetical protein